MLNTPPPSLVGADVIHEMCLLLRTTPQEGCVVEVGVYKGGTLWHLSQAAESRPVYGYDTFSGLPYKDDVDELTVGTFGDTSLAEVSRAVPEVTLIEGLFPDSAVDMPRVAFAHIDCDQYRAVKECIEYFMPRMLPEGIIWFDDFGYLTGATTAVYEFFHPAQLNSACGKVYVRIK